MVPTALYIAASEGHTRCVEALVGYGADVTITNAEGKSPLHQVLQLQNMKPLSEWTLFLNEVYYTV